MTTLALYASTVSRRPIELPFDRRTTCGNSWGGH
jgi:hypothetical protein